MVSLGAYDAARRAAAALDRSDRGRIVVSGADRATFLHGLLTNDVASLRPGEGCYAAYLTPQGRMITDLWVYELGDRMLLALGLDTTDMFLARLDQLIFSEDVQVAGETSARRAVAIVGPDSARVVAEVVTGASPALVAGLPEHGSLNVQFGNSPAVVVRVTDTGEPGYDVLVDASRSAALGSTLAAQGLAWLDTADAEAMRIEAGVPKFHVDMDEETIPLEAGIEARAISMTKGCYVGQEVIVRILHRGHGRIARRLVGLVVDGDVAPEPRSSVHANGREAGHVTSSAQSPALRRPVALAYLQRDFLEPGTPVTVAGVPALVTALPFVSRSS